MIQAYRRGLLKREHPFGVRSRLRETILLESIEAEGVAESAYRKIELRTAMVASLPLNQTARQKVVKDAFADLKCYDLMRYMDYDGAAQVKFDNSSLALTTVYEILQRTGVIPE
jgi:hypothetical protein